jgi:hypothetical protein
VILEIFKNRNKIGPSKPRSLSYAIDNIIDYSGARGIRTIPGPPLKKPFSPVNRPSGWVRKGLKKTIPITILETVFLRKNLD